MTLEWRIDKELTKDTVVFFGSSHYVIHYDLDPANHSSLNRLIVIDEVPGKVAQLFGMKTVRRYFVGRIRWHEILDDRKIVCPTQMELELSKMSDNLEQKYRKMLKVKRIKASQKK